MKTLFTTIIASFLIIGASSASFALGTDQQTSNVGHTQDASGATSGYYYGR